MIMTEPQWNASTGQALQRIIEEHPGILNDPDSLAGLLADFLSRQETNVLITAMKYTNQRKGEVNLSCSLRRDTGQAVSTGHTRGALPDPHYPKLMRTGWLVVFEQPASGWQPGHYLATCSTEKGMIQGWLDVAS